MEKIPEKDRRENFWQGRTAEDLRKDGPSRELLRMEAADLHERFDPARGGFAGLDTDQESGVLMFLLEYARREDDDGARALAEAVLERRKGDGGPLGAYANLEAYAQTGRPLYREAACGMLDRALEERQLPGGGFTKSEKEAATTLWNAQMIAALSKASRLLGGKKYLQGARDARLFLKNRLTQSNGRLWRIWQDRQPVEEGRLEDYAFCCWALLELYESDFSVSCLREAEALADRMANIFQDIYGGFYELRTASTVGSGAAGLALSRLARLTAVNRYRNLTREQLAWLAGTERETPDGLGLLGMVEMLYPRQELVCISAGKIPAWLAPVGEEYRLAAVAKTDGNSWGLENVVPYVREFPVPEVGIRLYLCRDGVCGTPADNLFQLYQQLSEAGLERFAEELPV